MLCFYRRHSRSKYSICGITYRIKREGDIQFEAQHSHLLRATNSEYQRITKQSRYHKNSNITGRKFTQKTARKSPLSSAVQQDIGIHLKLFWASDFGSMVFRPSHALTVNLSEQQEHFVGDLGTIHGTRTSRVIPVCFRYLIDVFVGTSLAHGFDAENDCDAA